MLYSTDNKGYYPPSFDGGSWNIMYGKVRDIMASSYNIGDGGIFYCPDYVHQAYKDPTAKSNSVQVAQKDNDWYNSIKVMDIEMYLVGYALFTYPMHSANNIDPWKIGGTPWIVNDGIMSPECSWAFFEDAASEPQDKGRIPAIKSTESGRTIKEPTRGVVTIKYTPASNPLLFDECMSTVGKGRTDVFTREGTRHFQSAKEGPYGLNTLYLDGHTEKNKKPRVFRNMGSAGYKRWY
jgi:hypothetical protein